MTAHVPRMDEREAEAWLGLVALLELLPASLDTQMQQDGGLTHFEFMVLSQLRLAPDFTLQAKALATATNATLPRLSHVVTRLAKRNLVHRVPCPEDRRATNVRLSSEGRRIVIRATSAHLAHVRRLIFDQLTIDEVETLSSITTKVNKALDPDDHITGAMRS